MILCRQRGMFRHTQIHVHLLCVDPDCTLNVYSIVIQQTEQRASSHHCTYSSDEDEMVLECAEDIKIPRREVILHFITLWRNVWREVFASYKYSQSTCFSRSNPNMWKFVPTKLLLCLLIGTSSMFLHHHPSRDLYWLP